MPILLFIVVLLLLVLVHEFGHFIVAKKAGIRVDEFAFGFPPKLWSMMKGETTYVVNALPLGGYVKIYGENPEEVTEGADQSRSFIAQPRKTQALVIVAGVFFNLLFAWFLFSAALMIGVPAPLDGGEGYPVVNPQLIVTGVADKSPALLAGLESGDVLQKLSDGTESVEIADPDQVIAFIGPREGHVLTLAYLHNNVAKVTTVIPASGIIPDTAAIGVYMDTVGTLALPPPAALWVGLKKTEQFTDMTVVGLAQLLAGIVTGHSDLSQVSGPVGIVRAVGDAAGVGFTNLLLFMAVISINLAVINLIPFPALDGGRLLFIVIEGLIRQPIKPKIANALNIAGFALLMLLMIVVTYHDITKLMH